MIKSESGESRRSVERVQRGLLWSVIWYCTKRISWYNQVWYNIALITKITKTEHRLHLEFPKGRVSIRAQNVCKWCLSYSYDAQNIGWGHFSPFVHVYKNLLTQWGRDKMAVTFQTTFSNTFSFMKMYKFWLRFDLNLFPMVQLTIFHHWFR